jgi:DNA-binding NtrC family response regulator
MGRLNVLLVDDDRNLVTTLSYGLRKALGEASSVAFCFSSSEALSILATQEFDVVVSDFNMPSLSGLEFLGRVRQDHPEMILILVTAYGTDALEEGVHQLGGDYINKPFEPAFLVQTIKRLLQDKEARGTIEHVSRVMEELGKPAGSSENIRLESRGPTSS